MILILMGVSGSGKTTIGKLLAQETGWPFYDGDHFHSPANVEKMRAGIPLTDEDRESWLATVQNLIQECLRAGQPALIACSALKQKYREYLQIDQARVHFVFLRGSYDLIAARLANRPAHFFSPRLLSSQFEALEAPSEVFTVDVSFSPQTVMQIIKQNFKL